MRCSKTLFSLAILIQRFTVMSKRSSSDLLKAVAAVPVVDGCHIKRCRLITAIKKELTDGDCIVYWMSRDQRVFDNYALLYAQGLALQRNVPLKVVFNLVPRFLDATIRQYGFMLKGLEEVEITLRSKAIPFFLLKGDPVSNIPSFAFDHKAIAVVVDFSPLRVPLNWVHAAGSVLDKSTSGMPLFQVDAHNIVPCWEASPKLEYGARTIRPKINNRFSEFLADFPEVMTNYDGGKVMEGAAVVDWKAALESLEIDRSVPEVTWLTPGYTAGMATLTEFAETRLKDFSDKRNDPTESVSSNLSPYFHFGQVSVQRAVLALKRLKKHPNSTDAFVEEAVVRRELADNFCFYNPHYDSLDGCYSWAKETLELHKSDKRSPQYLLADLEAGRTHDDLWNAAQLQMVSEGKMHGFLRMYWAKKILEWTVSPEEALRIAIFLNDKYELDGRDPNGYVGCMWSIGGIHDQGWGERAIFGKIRYMNYEGCKRKFNVAAFVKKYPPAAQNAAAISKGAFMKSMAGMVKK